jgi:hypothetical protein
MEDVCQRPPVEGRVVGRKDDPLMSAVRQDAEGWLLAEVEGVQEASVVERVGRGRGW